MGFFSGIGSNLQALGQKLGGALEHVGTFAQNVASPILGAVQQAQAIQGQLEQLGRPPIAGTGSQPIAGEHPIAPLVAAPTAQSSSKTPFLVLGGLALAVVLLSRGKRP
jgi:hypothetical protein